jgi:hypothetical protein
MDAGPVKKSIAPFVGGADYSSQPVQSNESVHAAAA